MPLNFAKTAMLLALLTAIFVAIGGLAGGKSGMVIAFVIALGMNAFSLWNSDKMVLRMYEAQEVDERSAPEFYGIVQRARGARRVADAARLRHGQRAAERLRDRPQPVERRRLPPRPACSSR